MTEKSNEILRDLNRLINDRGLPPKVRNKAQEAARHIQKLREEIQQLQEEDITRINW